MHPAYIGKRETGNAEKWGNIHIKDAGKQYENIFLFDADIASDAPLEKKNSNNQ